MLKQVIIALVLALCLVQTCSAIKCYSCRSTLEPKCADEKIDATSLLRQVDCDTEPRDVGVSATLPVTKCQKVITKDRAGVVVTRGCHFEEVGGDSSKCTVSQNQNVDSCQICKGDLCNSASGYTAMGVMAVLAVVAATLTL